MTKETLFLVIDGFNHWYDEKHLQGRTVEAVPYMNKLGQLTRYYLVVSPHNDLLFNHKKHNLVKFVNGRTQCGHYQYESCWIAAEDCHILLENNRSAAHLLSLD